MKIFTLAPNENWCVDRLVDEWNENHNDIITHSYNDADIIWLNASWCFNHLPYEILKQKKVVTTIHHITSPQLINSIGQFPLQTAKEVNEKFFSSQQEMYDFKKRHDVTDIYHVPCEHTKWQLDSTNGIFNRLGLAPKEIRVIPFWINDKLWTPRSEDVGEKTRLRKKYGLPTDGRTLFGSFQRDSEGETLEPKLEKGGDLFVPLLAKLRGAGDLHAVLTPWRRQAVKKLLLEANVGSTSPLGNWPNGILSFQQVNELYACLDFYLVTSRVEGGPLAVSECAATKTPILSHYVGLAQDGWLDKKSVLKYVPGEEFDMEFAGVIAATEQNYENSKKLFISKTGFVAFEQMFDDLHMS
jgi:hypothetical protein